MTENRFNLEHLRKAIKPFRLHWLARVGSTNDQAALLRKAEKLFAPAIVLTGHQLAGRGRNSNTWWSGPGSLTVTFVLPIDSHLSPHQLPLIAGLAVRNALAEVCGGAAIQLKWPNDLLFEGHKLAGLLCERVHKADLIGLGVNVNLDARVPKTLRQNITWLSEIAHRNLDKSEVLIAVLKHLHPMLTRPREYPFASILREYDHHHALIGKKVSITDNGHDAPISGTCEGLDSLGRLLIRSRGQIHRIIAGHVVVK